MVPSGAEGEEDGADDTSWDHGDDDAGSYKDGDDDSDHHGNGRYNNDLNSTDDESEVDTSDGTGLWRS